MLHIDTTILVCSDIQENLAKAMFDRERLVANTVKLISGINVLGIPVLWTEQNPERLGATLPEISAVMPKEVQPFSKLSFSCCGSEEFAKALKAHGYIDVLLAGIETHICVLQTAMDLLEQGTRRWRGLLKARQKEIDRMAEKVGGSRKTRRGHTRAGART